MRAVFGLALLGAAMLGGCGQPEAQIRDEIRAQLMNRCARDVALDKSLLPGFDNEVFCGCITDKAMGQRSVAELNALFDEGNRPQMLAQGRQAATECLAQLRESGATDTAAPAPSSPDTATPTTPPAAARERPREKAAEPTAPPRPRIEETRETPSPSTQPAVPPRTTPPPPQTSPPPPRPEPERAPADRRAEPGDRP